MPPRKDLLGRKVSEQRGFIYVGQAGNFPRASGTEALARKQVHGCLNNAGMSPRSLLIHVGSILG